MMQHVVHKRAVIGKKLVSGGVLAVLLTSLTLLAFLASCRGDVEVVLSEELQLLPDDRSAETHVGFYLLNEGNMGSNKATLDFLDFKRGVYRRNIYAEINPTVPKEMGDVGNDIAIYGSRLYAVINCSNKIEVMNARTTKRIGQVEIPNCRYIQFHGRYAYVTSYAGPVTIDPHYEQLGYVAKVDTATLEVVDRCLVGFQPDELEIVGGKIYIANSGGYMGAGDLKGYERTVSVIDIATFKEEKRIPVAWNLHRIKADKRGDLWVSSRGDYKGYPSRLYFLDRELQQVTDTVPIAATNYWIDDDYLYAYGTEYSYVSAQEWSFSYAIVDTRTHEVVTKDIITDDTEKKIEMPYGIMVHPVTKEIYITDAGNFVTPGALYCFTPYGKLKWKVRTGNIPAHFALLPQP